MKSAVLLCLLAFVAVRAEDSLEDQLNALVPDAKNAGASSDASFTGPLKAKMFQLSKKLESELAQLTERKNDMAAALAKAKLSAEEAGKVADATKNELERKEPAKMESDYNVVLSRAALEVVIRAAKRQIKLNNLERDALYAEIKFAEQAQVLRSRVVGEKPPVALISVDDLESELSPAARSVIEKKETVLSNDIKGALEELLRDCRERLADLQKQDDANAAEIKKLQADLRAAVDTQTVAVKDWKVAKDDFSRAASTLAKTKGMYNEMVRIAQRDGAALEQKIQTVQKEIKLVGTMITKIEAYKPESE